MKAKEARAYANTAKSNNSKELNRFFNAAREFMDNMENFYPGDPIRMTYSSLLISKDGVSDLWDMGYVVEVLPVVGGSDNYLICW